MAQQDHLGTTATTVSTGEDGKTRVTYHNTDVVTFDADEIILNHGGYMTATTKTRMNQASNQLRLGFKVFQKKGYWFVEIKGEAEPQPWGNVVEAFDRPCHRQHRIYRDKKIRDQYGAHYAGREHFPTRA